jgi:hypothetical protein
MQFDNTATLSLDTVNNLRAEFAKVQVSSPTRGRSSSGRTSTKFDFSTLQAGDLVELTDDLRSKGKETALNNLFAPGDVCQVTKVVKGYCWIVGLKGSKCAVVAREFSVVVRSSRCGDRTDVVGGSK